MVHGCEFLKLTAPKMHWPLIIDKAAFPRNSLYTIKHYNVLGKDPAINFFLANLNSKHVSFQQTNTYSKSTIEPLRKSVKYVQS